MAETRGYQTINDRTDGWGVGVVEADQPTADATPEATSARIGREVAVRNSDPVQVDGAYETPPSDGEILTWDSSNTAKTTAHSDVAATNRTKQALKIDLDPVAGSIADRTDGWGPDGGLDPQVDFDDDGIANTVDPDIDNDGDLNATDPDDFDPLVDSVV